MRKTVAAAVVLLAAVGLTAPAPAAGAGAVSATASGAGAASNAAAGAAAGAASASGAAAGSAAADGPSVVVAGEVTAGASVPVTVSGVTDGAIVTLTVIGSLGSLVLTGTAAGGSAGFTLDGEITRGTGTFTLLAEVDGQVATGSLDVLPGAAVGPVQPIVGARSIVADGADRSMVVAIPVDIWGNAVAEGTTVDVSHRSPTGEIGTAPTTMSHLLAWLELTAGTVAGRGNVWLDVGGVTGQQVSLDEVPSAPLPFTVAAVDPGLPTRLGADGQTLIAVRTSVLADQYGNVEPDGTLVTLEWDAPEGRARTSALTISGVAELWIQAPVEPAALTLTGLCRGTPSATPLVLDFPSVVEGFAIDTGPSDFGLAVRLGPVNRAGGTYVPDGTTATVTLTDAGGSAVSASGGLVDGEIELVLPVSALTGPIRVTAEVLGTTQTYDVG